LLDSAGDSLSHRGTLYTASITCKAEQDGDAQMGGEFGFAHDFDSIDSELDAIGRRAAGFATELLGAGPVPTLRCPAILRNNAVAELLDFLASSFSAEEAHKGRSILAGKLGERLFSPQLTLIDDGLLPGGLMTAPFDGEGVPKRKTLLVEDGTFRSFLYDLYHARKLGASPTGSAVRSVKAPPAISVSNLYIPNGTKEASELAWGIDRGVLLTDLMGVHTANPVTGDFSLGASGFLIENGQVSRPIKGFAVAGNVLEVFRKITDIGNDMRFFGNIGAPSVRIAEIAIGGS
jgi:PmbA protein